jgi:hypothetical protein
MNKPVPDIYRKQFASRYEHAREQQILEYLGQRQGPVPPVVLSHAEDGYLDMHHGGTNLHQWLTASQVNTPTALQVLANALSALISTSQLGVWHIDIALRNFVVQDRGERDAPRVWLIDFGNAICPHFALQKPLWMLPHAEQHPTLQKALIQDWQSFYQRHHLPHPADWHAPFDVSKHMYDEDWSQGFQVESMTLRWCITAHGTAKILLQSASLVSEFPDPLRGHFVGLLNLQDEADAQSRLENCLLALQNACVPPVPFDAGQTPRPRMASPGLDPAQSIQPAITNPSNPLHTAAIKPAPTPADAAPLPQATSVSRAWLSWAAAVCIAVGWWVLDVGYIAQGQAISGLTMVVAGLSVLFFVVGVLGWLRRAHTPRWWVRSLWLQVAGQWVLALELWAFGMPVGTVWAMGLAPAMAMLALVFA